LLFHLDVSALSYELSGLSELIIQMLISYFPDGGLTYPITLLSNTPNDESQVVTVPGVVTNTARAKVICNGNIFFDISNNNFSITSSPLFLEKMHLSGYVNNKNAILSWEKENDKNVFKYDIE